MRYVICILWTPAVLTVDRSSHAHPSALSRGERVSVSHLIFALFDRWGLSAAEQAELLGFSAATRSTITRYRNGAPMGEGRDTLDRCANLLRIHEALNALLPEGAGAVRQDEWLRRPNRAFDGRPPMETMRSGFEGLTLVRRYLETMVQH
jgi:transcriptional regulator with XRE-family HTH domain